MRAFAPEAHRFVLELTRDERLWRWAEFMASEPCNRLSRVLSSVRQQVD